MKLAKSPEGSEEQGKMEKTGCEISCGARTTLAVKGEMMMMVMIMMMMIVPMGFLPWEIRVAFHGKSQVPNPKCMLGVLVFP